MSDLLIFSPGAYQSYGHSFDYSKGLAEAFIKLGYNVFVFGVDGPLRFSEDIHEIRIKNSNDLKKKQTLLQKIRWGFSRILTSSKTASEFSAYYNSLDNKPLVIFETFEYFGLGRYIKHFSGNCYSIFHDTNFNFRQTSLIAGIYKLLARRPARKIVRHSIMSYVHGNQMKNNLIEQLGPSCKNNVKEIPYGAPPSINLTIEDSKLAKKELDLEQDKLHLLSFGTLRSDKEFLPIIKAIASSERWNWLIAGPEGDYSYKKIHEMVKEYNIEDRVITIERFIKNDEQKLFFAAADAAVNLYKPFIRHESGTAQLARTYVKPVIVSGPPDLTEYVTKKNIGWVLNKNLDCSHILKLYEGLSTKEKQEILQNIKKLANANSWDTVAGRILKYSN